MRVLVGRAVGADFREFEASQILRTWKMKFESFHDLMCAVEASWVVPGTKEPLEADAVLEEFDLNLGPSHPGPCKPPILGKEEDAVVISPGGDKKKLVTALAIAEEGGRPILYSGHDDGHMTKWSLEDNSMIWSKQIYADGTKDFERYSSVFVVKETPGVAGIIARKHPTKEGEYLLYTWSHAYEGYPDEDYDDRGPSQVKVWRGHDGKFQKSYECDVGDDRDGNSAHPSIACVVFCKLFVNRSWQDALIVGLHCICPKIRLWDEDYSDFDLEEAQEVGEGNILPFYEHRGVAMETWRDHSGIIRAMAVVPNKYLLSSSMRYGNGLPDAMVLWDLQNPGVPLCRHNFWDPSRSLFKQNRTRLGDNMWYRYFWNGGSVCL